VHLGHLAGRLRPGPRHPDEIVDLRTGDQEEVSGVPVASRTTTSTVTSSRSTAEVSVSCWTGEMPLHAIARLTKSRCATSTATGSVPSSTEALSRVVPAHDIPHDVRDSSDTRRHS